jgi:nucleoside 2-deoxyribosyltransferase
MEGLTKEEMTGWRNELQSLVNPHPEHYLRIATFLDPCRRLAFHECGRDLNTCKRIFTSDLRDIDASDLIVIDARRKQGRGTGTAMEAMYAWTKQKPFILWQDEWDSIHPFYESMCYQKVTSLADVAKAIEYFTQ